MDGNKNVWNEIRIRSLKEFIDNISELKPNSMIFRGECDSSFELQSSLRRLMPIFKKIRNNRSSQEQLMISIEDDFVNRFECNNQLYSPSRIDYGLWTKLDKISVLQHFGRQQDYWIGVILHM